MLVTSTKAIGRTYDTANGNAQARILLQPIAAPSARGLYAFAASTLTVVAQPAGW